MPICFQLFDKNTNEAVSLSKLDDILCTEVLKVQPDPKLYGGGHVKGAFNWFDTIGFMIASGKELGSQELRDHYLASDMWADEAPLIRSILDYLEEHYTSNSFYATKN